MLAVAAFVFTYYTFWALLTVGRYKLTGGSVLGKLMNELCISRLSVVIALSDTNLTPPRLVPTSGIRRRPSSHPCTCRGIRSSSVHRESDDEGSKEEEDQGGKGRMIWIEGEGLAIVTQRLEPGTMDTFCEISGSP
jgi:hypothetical protein